VLSLNRPSADELDSWIAIGGDGRVTAYFGKMDMAKAVDVAWAQMVAEELDLPIAMVSVIAGDTAWTVDQGGTSGSTGVQRGGVALACRCCRGTSAAIRGAAARFGVTADKLSVTDGIISITAAPGKHVSYAELWAENISNLKLSGNGSMATA